MPKYNANQQVPLRNADQEWSRQLRRRGVDLYGEGEDYGEGNKPFSTPASPRYPGRQEKPSGFRYGDQEHEDLGNYGRGGYYGSTYDQEAYNRDRERQRMG